MAAEPPKYAHGVLFRVEGPILPSMVSYLDRKLDAAKEAGADLVILEIDSPGGLLTESEQIASRLVDVDWAHTVAYIPERALSGAAIVALGCDEILMAPDAHLGDAGPIIFGPDRMFEHASEKVVSDLTNTLRNLAKAKGRPRALAEAMADRKQTVFEYRNVKTGKTEYMSERQAQGLKDRADWKQGARVEESGGDRFLDVSGTRAVELGLAQAVVSSREELAPRYGLERLQESGAMDTLVSVLNSPWITGLILALGLLGLYIEFMSPGMGLGGVLAAVCFGLFFWSHVMGGMADWLGVLLFLGGVALIAVELFVLPGTGIPGVAGAGLVLASVVMSQAALVPESPRQLQMLANTLLVVFTASVGVVIAATFISKRFGTLPVFRRLTVAPPAAGVDAAALDGFALPPVQPGDLGMAHTPLRPGGRARFGDHFVDVLTDGDFVNRGRPVRVVRVSGHQVFVADAEGTA
jgi:membrane-bound serine protease (ClpP class)